MKQIPGLPIKYFGRGGADSPYLIKGTTVLPLLNSDSKMENSDFFLTIFRGKFGLFSDLLSQYFVKNADFVVNF